ncbi:MAG: PEP-CTERM sorting domain-containing protein [Candidatus Acidiferrales bacterium]
MLVLSDLSVTPVSTTPEPASVALFGTGLLALAFFVKRFRITGEGVN